MIGADARLWLIVRGLAAGRTALGGTLGRDHVA
jgi:hypothetical protein